MGVSLSVTRGLSAVSGVHLWLADPVVEVGALLAATL